MSTESISSMMNDECQVMCSIDMCLCSVVFVQILVDLYQGLLTLRWCWLLRCILEGQKRAEGKTGGRKYKDAAVKTCVSK